MQRKELTPKPISNGVEVIINKKEVAEIYGTETDLIPNSLALQYYAIQQDFKAKRFPPTEQNYIQRFKQDYATSMSVDEFLQLKEYAETVYRYDLSDQINEDYSEGRYEKLL